MPASPPTSRPSRWLSRCVSSLHNLHNGGLCTASGPLTIVLTLLVLLNAYTKTPVPSTVVPPLPDWPPTRGSLAGTDHQGTSPNRHNACAHACSCIRKSCSWSCRSECRCVASTSHLFCSLAHAARHQPRRGRFEHGSDQVHGRGQIHEGAQGVCNAADRISQFACLRARVCRLKLPAFAPVKNLQALRLWLNFEPLSYSTAL